MYFSNASVRVIPCSASSSLPLRFMVPSSLSDVVSLGFAYIPASYLLVVAFGSRISNAFRCNADSGGQGCRHLG